MVEKRIYSRMPVEIVGNLFVEHNEIPIIIYNISDRGVGFRYLYRDCPEDFRVKKNQKICIVFYDPDERLFHDNAVQQCEFTVIQTRDHTKHSYVGGKLTFSETNYSQYVLDKKSLRMMNDLKIIRWNYENSYEMNAI